MRMSVVKTLASSVDHEWNRMLMVAKLKNIILIFASLLIALFLVELVLRSLGPLYTVGPIVTVYDHQYGKRLKKGFSAEIIDPEFTVTFSTNSYGFRGPEPASFPHHPVLFLGDSFTVGHGVSDGEEFPEVVRQGLLSLYGEGAPPVVNAGMGANGNGRWVKFLKLKGGDYAPRLVVLQLFANDFFNNKYEKLFELSVDKRLVEKQVPSEGLIRKIQWFVDKVPIIYDLHLFGLLNHVRARFKYDLFCNSETTSNEDLLTYRLLEEVISVCDQQRWPVIVIYHGIEGERLAKLKSIFKERDILMMRIPNQDERSDLYYEIDGHWNARGHSFVADLILNELKLDSGEL
jgi:hypothetical protein